jgi:hypothetical protein
VVVGKVRERSVLGSRRVLSKMEGRPELGMDKVDMTHGVYSDGRLIF